MKEEIWIEKYRPRNLDQIIGQTSVTSRLKSYARARKLPHLLFSGPPGVGKTAAAVALTRELFGDVWHENFIELNASDERGIETVRTKIKTFARLAPRSGADFKIIFLDESDSLTDAAQSALRRTMEQYSSTCRFILSCNYSSKIIEPIQSRCAIFRFKPLSMKDMIEQIRWISEQEGVTISDEGIDAICEIARGDMRRAINALQSAAALEKPIEREMIYEITATVSTKDVMKLINLAIDEGFDPARKELNDIFDRGVASGEILDVLARRIFDFPISDQAKIELMERIGEADYRITEGANERLQMEALIAYVSLNREKTREKNYNT
ncbi:replication factor C small subunit [Methanosarcinales archaeon]|uniref:Replication factor C small subunit n=1 Tax=Candidatus Syntropharchaeum caldarium TaxID=1838285 RepID=A0A1F2PAB9_9EURY|nr:MAG: replication factor C small subunit [Candidatus Syntrophoarchaeum caldarius]RLG32883.1 MAG: replication factor C small subunit [Methanosarcinales archaeon]